MTEAKEDELENEAEWIYINAFIKPTISDQVGIGDVLRISNSRSLSLLVAPRRHSEESSSEEED